MRGIGDRGPRAKRARLGVALGLALGLAPGLTLGLTLAWPTPLLAQTAPSAPSITAPETVAVAPRGAVALPVTIGPAASIPAKAFLRLRGFPPTAALSEGYSIAPGAWAVALNALPNLKVTLPGSAAGRTEITLALVSVEGNVLAERKVVLVASAQPPVTGTPGTAKIMRAAPVEPPPAAPKSAALSPPPAAAPAPTPPPPPTLKPEQRARALRLMKRGEALVGEANLAEARLLFEKAADIGLAEAAMALAATYDQEELSRLAIRGARPEPALARRWYERAAQLGAREAQQRLQRLSTN